jgi:putative PIN family toxin of toxin-antitoxin system
VLFAALVSDGLCHELTRRVAGMGSLALSEPIIAELRDVVLWKFPKDTRVAGFIRDLRRFALIVEPTSVPRDVCRDPEDAVVLGTAVSAQASVAVSGDKDLLSVGSFEGIKILSPRACVQWLDRVVVPKR